MKLDFYQIVKIHHCSFDRELDGQYGYVDGLSEDPTASGYLGVHLPSTGTSYHFASDDILVTEITLNWNACVLISEIIEKEDGSIAIFFDRSENGLLTPSA